MVLGPTGSHRFWGFWAASAAKKTFQKVGREARYLLEGGSGPPGPAKPNKSTISCRSRSRALKPECATNTTDRRTMGQLGYFSMVNHHLHQPPPKQKKKEVLHNKSPPLGPGSSLQEDHRKKVRGLAPPPCLAGLVEGGGRFDLQIQRLRALALQHPSL